MSTSRTINMAASIAKCAILKLLMENPKHVIAKSVLLDRISMDTPDCTERS